MQFRFFFVGCLAAALFAGCGSSDSGPSDDRPRVEGNWRVVTTSLDRQADETRFTWTITPECPAGPCGFRVSSKTTGNKFRYRFDKAIGDYLQDDQYVDDCVNLSTNALIARNAYTVATQTVLRVSDSVISDEDGVDYATQLTGEEKEKSRKLTAEAEAAGCSPKGTDYSVYAVRLDKPEGKSGSAAPQANSALDGLPGE